MTTTRSPSPLIIENVSKQFELPGRVIDALSEVSFEIRPGQVTGLIGADAAGKTTLMRLISGLLTLDKGRITVLGKDVAKAPLAIQSSIGYMPQQFGLYQDLTVMENLRLYADLQGLPEAQRPDRFQQLLDMSGLSSFGNRLAGKLSGGMKQKLGLACTLVKSPELLLLDEPTVGVDPVSRRELWQIVYQAVEENGMSVLLSTAYLDEAERCHDIKLLHEGRLLAQGAPEHFTQPLKNRTFLLSADKTTHKRQLKKQLAAQPFVQDALIMGESVRILTRDTVGTPAELLQKLPGIEPADRQSLQVEAVESRFEDAFVDLLSQQTEFAPVLEKETVQHFAQASAVSDDLPAIEVDKLVCRFGDFVAVDHLSFQVQRGEIFGLLGANGAGKTTTFRMLCGLLPATDGHLQVAGHNLRHARAQARAKLGYMSQKFSLYGVMSVAQNLDFYSKIYGLKGTKRRERVDWAIETFELQELLKQPSRDLPLGFKQRLAMACALMHEPDILFLDEPTSGVDPMGRRDFWNKINALAEKGVTIMVTTHFMEEAEYCDRMAIMSNGRIMALGTPADIKQEAGRSDMEEAFIHIIEADKSAEAGE
ncbi:ATP-binding cassette domain-containing protein [Thiomicrorhabdus xiamenensis]|uniref:ABC transporter ATP-binding protein n=1 Tax=Thiomicrorhabdus xiamenensis TaxID=2739063 RepID=A0A7D4NK95_9GAMM|nr:ATP-binding cassette domain-containing protein [Thiomicrorhabdus xiamenensis]QKI89049.1 ABC transporter ATP-binding protein [Thiomicrorhabdus xiamenensis]